MYQVLFFAFSLIKKKKKRLIAGYHSRVVQKAVNANTGLTVNKSINSSFIKTFLTSYVSKLIFQGSSSSKLKDKHI